MTEVWRILLGTVGGLGAIVVLLLCLLLGFCLLLDLSKFRRTRGSKTVKSLDELVGPAITYLPPDVPRGPSDQLAGSSVRAS